MPRKKETKSTPKSTPIDSVNHHDKRANIPTEELRDFMSDDEKKPQKVLYPRDSSLDPQLVWKGKDDQDRQDLEVPAVPIYIQEVIQPNDIIQDFRRHYEKEKTSPFQLSLFNDINPLDFDQKIEFYQHETDWANRMILGDSLLVMNSLAEKEGLKGKIQMIYMDPPYGIKFGSKQIPPTPLNKGGVGGIKTENDIRKGFIYKRVPHITLKSIANNPEIDTIHEKWQLQLEPLRSELNQLLKKSWEEWEIPREAEAKWSDKAKELLSKWWLYRQKRQQEIDESIARNADTELLYDQPYEDNKRIRVTGPFTVESLSPHRILSTDEEYPASEQEGITQASDEFEIRIIENLKKAGIQNTFKKERLKFENLEYLESHAGTYIHGVGEYRESDETIKRVAIHIGPEYGTVGIDDIKEAAKEAVKGLGYDVLIICGFAFEPNVNEEAKHYGKLQVLITRMNPDLLLGDELLKKTGAGNLFMVFGEPDIDLKRENHQLIVTLKGVDIYDPTTGEIRSSSPDDIACWFIDTDYNGESFFVRHAYFTGGNQPLDKLKRALKAEIDEEAWSQIYSTTSRPFDTPKGKNGKGGKIAVKVINHYGNEVLKVYDV